MRSHLKANIEQGLGELSHFGLLLVENQFSSLDNRMKRTMTPCMHPQSVLVGLLYIDKRIRRCESSRRSINYFSSFAEQRVFNDKD